MLIPSAGMNSVPGSPTRSEIIVYAMVSLDCLDCYRDY
jgi:hypothetical protein